MRSSPLPRMLGTAEIDPGAAIPLRSPAQHGVRRTIALNVLHDGAQQPYGTTK